MITIIHGDNIGESRGYYSEQKEKYSEKVILEGATLTYTDLLQAISGSGLFGNQQVIFIEDMLSKRKPSKELENIIHALTAKEQKPETIFLLESKELTTKQLSPFKTATIKQFKIPQTVFSFLDSFAPGNGKKTMLLFHQLLRTEDVHFVLFMLQRHVRILLALTKPSEPAISEVKRMAPWQRGKMEKQAKLFTQERLLTLHETLYQLELGQKTGKLTLALDQAIDFLLLPM